MSAGQMTATIPAQRAFAVDRLYSSAGLPFDTEGRAVFTWKLSEQQQQIPAAADETVLTRPIVSLAQEGYSNYYHWMTEIVPKFRFLPRLRQALGFHVDEEVLVALPADGPAFIRQTVDLLIPTETILWLQPGRVYRSRAGIWAIEPSPTFGFVTPEAIGFLRNRFGTASSDDSEANALLSQPQRRIFISRSRAARRRILNEDQVFAELFAPLGFTRHCLEDLSLVEQVRLFRDAQFVAGEHGAAFTNILFAAPGKCHLLEIFQRREDASFYYLTQMEGCTWQWPWRGVKTVPFEETGDLLGGMEETIVPLDPIREALAQEFIDTMH